MKQQFFWQGQSEHRKRQITKWFFEETRRVPQFKERMQSIQILLENGKNALAERSMNRIIDDTNNGALQYISDEFKTEEFMLRIFTLAQKRPQEKKALSTKDLKRRLSKQQRFNEIKRFGFTKTGERKEATLIKVFVKGKPQDRLRDIKTGRFLKKTETLKQELKK